MDPTLFDMLVSIWTAMAMLHLCTLEMSSDECWHLGCDRSSHNAVCKRKTWGLLWSRFVRHVLHFMRLIHLWWRALAILTVSLSTLSDLWLVLWNEGALPLPELRWSWASQLGPTPSGKDGRSMTETIKGWVWGFWLPWFVSILCCTCYSLFCLLGSF